MLRSPPRHAPVVSRLYTHVRGHSIGAHLSLEGVSKAVLQQFVPICRKALQQLVRLSGYSTASTQASLIACIQACRQQLKQSVLGLYVHQHFLYSLAHWEAVPSCVLNLLFEDLPLSLAHPVQQALEQALSKHKCPLCAVMTVSDFD